MTKTIQQKCCKHYNAKYLPPDSEQLVVISEGIYKGVVPIEGVRYQSPSHMSGWWLTTDQYDGNTDKLKTVHYYHVEEKRPDIAIYMALPYGYRFQLGGDEDHVWFDEVIANEDE